MKVICETYKCRVKYTRIITANTYDRSIIDYCIVSDLTWRSLKQMEIDEEGTMRLEGRKPKCHNTVVLPTEITGNVRC